MAIKCLVTGSNGLVGSALQERVKKKWKNKERLYTFVNRDIANLTYQNSVRRLFDRERPHYVIHTAAKVGGVGGNIAEPADYFYQNTLMNSFLLHYAAKFGVQKLIAFSSVCAFPTTLRELEEDKMHDGPPWEDNYAYAISKRNVDIFIRALKKQYGIKNYCSIIPGNIVGKNDLYDLKHGHVLPMLIYKIYKAKHFGEEFVVWGDGNSMREFIYSEDLAEICFQLLEMDELPERIIVSGEREYSIREVVDVLIRAANYKGKVHWDTSKPNGQRSRPSNKSVFRSYFPDFQFTPLEEMIYIAYSWFESNYPNVRGVLQQ